MLFYFAGCLPGGPADLSAARGSFQHPIRGRMFNTSIRLAPVLAGKQPVILKQRLRALVRLPRFLPMRRPQGNDH